jgi:hypothetical protein
MPVISDQNVLRLDISMYDVLGSESMQSKDNFSRVELDKVYWHLAMTHVAFVDELCEAASACIFEDVIEI